MIIEFLSKENNEFLFELDLEDTLFKRLEVYSKEINKSIEETIELILKNYIGENEKWRWDWDLLVIVLLVHLLLLTLM